MSRSEFITFGDICCEVRKVTKDPIADGFERYIGLEHLDSGSLKINRWGLISEDKVGFTRIFTKGQILLGKRRSYLRKAAIAEFDGVCSGDIIVLDKKMSEPASEILHVILQTDQFWEWAVKKSTGSLSPRTKFKELASFTMPRPGSSTVKRLKSAFEKAANLIRCQDDALISANKLFNTFLIESLSPRAIWPMKSLDEISDIKGGRQRSPAHMTGENILPYLRPANVKRGKINLADVLEMNFTPEEQLVFKLEVGDIILVEGGESGDVGDSAFYNLPENHCYQNTLIRVRAKKELVDPRCLYWLLTYLHRSGGFLAIAAGTKIKHIGTKNTAKLKVPFPPELELKKICSALDALETYLYELEEGRVKLVSLIKGFSRIIYN
ncbi:Type I restriction-modification system, specificity subunit S [Pseudomonas sp. R4-34-07]|uniref:restriction endonuclease subunit S n=1 Tax=Pseudomonas sp. R4-34-07 TaxID=658642 RepID=UPI000F5799F0|nr:restriction endonuclease subunit S [Pseudomonas sp. R4-34-07]AZF55116.1 Type I restriction-modification system, specificity subunit S [Pseudomonas sp. R4-34-07]